MIILIFAMEIFVKFPYLLFLKILKIFKWIQRKKILVVSLLKLRIQKNIFKKKKSFFLNKINYFFISFFENDIKRYNTVNDIEKDILDL